MDEKLILKDDSQKQKEVDSNLLLFLMVGVAGVGYATIMGMIYYDIHNMNQNLDKLMDITNDAIAFAGANINATAMEGVRYSLNEIAECVLHKYCRRVPE